MTRSPRWFPLPAAAILGILLAAGPLSAQYFGRNQVQYRNFDFQVLRTEHFDVHFYPEEERAARDAARMAERWYHRLSTLLNYQFEERQPLILYANATHFHQTNAVGTGGEGVGGVTESAKQRIVMPFTGSYEEFDQVLGHELVHAFQYDITGLGRSGGRPGAGGRGLATAPLWFVEGMAQYLTLGPVDVRTAMWLRDAALTGELPSFERLTYDPRLYPYTYGHALWSYIAGRWGDAVVGQILKQVGQGVPYTEAFQRLTNSTLEEIVEDWHASIRRAYLPMLAERPEAREVARPLITQRKEGGRLNLGPVLSPDGRWVVFLTELSGIDIELWLANAETGEVVKRLVKGPTVDPHFGSLRFIASAGTFSPDGKLFAFSALRGGEDVIVLLDVERARVVREVSVPGVPDITNPTWSPDGRTLVFSGNVGGISDLYSFDLETREVRRLTNDVNADMMPSFSPDGRTIAFVTDRGAATDLSTLQYGGHEIALYDLATGQVRVLTNLAGSSTNPVWARDGQSIYFKSSWTGIPNIYRMEVGTGALHQVTQLFTGVSGITDLSPAITTASQANKLLFTAFEKGGYNIYSLTTAKELEGTPVTEAVDTVIIVPGVEAPRAAVLPPIPRPQEAAYNRVALAVADPLAGLPSPTVAATWTVEPYSPSLGLDYLGQPQVGVTLGGGAFGSGVQGGIAGVWSDMLGRHTLFGAVQAQGQLDEIGFSTIYLYRRNRWNYGATAQRIPYISLAQQVVRDEVNGREVGRYELIRLRYFDTSLQGLTQYPFSEVQRFEASAGLRRLAQDAKVLSFLFDPVSGAQLTDFQESSRDGQAFNLAEASAALVYDNALLGATSPFAGMRYRFELSPTIGDLQMVQALGDFRRYFWFRPFTFATRGIHFGRYGRDAEGVFQPLFLGYPSIIRGYSYGDVRNACSIAIRQAPNAGQLPSECRLVNQLFGSRIAAVNMELRFPLIRSLVLGFGPIGLPPIEGIAFVDAGTAWGSGDQLVFERGVRLDSDTERGILTSAGVGARVNLLGYVILEVDYVRPFERERGWMWQFSLQPGF